MRDTVLLGRESALPIGLGRAMDSEPDDSEQADDMTLSGRIKMGMAAQGIGSPAELARRLSVDRQRVHKWLNDEVQNMDHASLFKLADVLGCSAKWLALREGPPQPPVALDLERTKAIQVFDVLEKAKMHEAWIRTGEAMISSQERSSVAYPFKPKART